MKVSFVYIVYRLDIIKASNIFSAYKVCLNYEGLIEVIRTYPINASMLLGIGFVAMSNN